MSAAEPSVAGRLITLGETMGLLTASTAGPLRANGTLTLTVAGAESNVAIGVRRLGLPAVWIGRVGRDDVGDLIVRELRAEGVDVRAGRDDAPTGLMLKGSRLADLTRVWYFRNASAGSHLSPAEVDAVAPFAPADLVHLTGITPALGPEPAAAVRRAIELAREAGARVSFDVNYRSALWSPTEAAPVLRELAGSSDLVFAGLGEAQLVAATAAGGDAEWQPLAAALAELGPREVVITSGSRGAGALADGTTYEQPAIAVRCIDSVGAGDAFVAGYLATALRGGSVEQRLGAAARTAAFAVATQGDWEGLPRADELDLLAAGDDVLR